MLATAGGELAALPALEAHGGLWHVRRSVIDRLNASVIRFDGHALITATSFEERGLAHHRFASVQSSRCYRLQAGMGDVGVYFPGGDTFIRIGSEPMQRVAHQCGADLYRGRLFFRGPDIWAEFWHVTGPRKHYVSLARYVRGGPRNDG